ncbi:MAG TPA: M20/M25/M40 family metallo-hydrolase [Kofleriaceae bacterium]|nr:M20/M25/M40 family metallo-hydrolase [Kofleriaceae bacterium]
MKPSPWTEADTQRLLTLLRIDTVTPMETGRLCDFGLAQAEVAAMAAEVGFEVLACEPAPSSVLDDPVAPVPLRERARMLGPSFFATQPNLVLRLGAGPHDRTLMFNVHLDTVSGEVPVACEAGRITGRGAADAKGLGVAVIVGIRRALAIDSSLPRRICILFQSVVGEEGGAMGIYGTRHLVQRGYHGRLNVVCEPTSSTAFDRTTASMTVRIAVDGVGATDDAPERGHNATILLGYLASTLARELAPQVSEAGGKMCIAGLATGDMHNRVYGTGVLLLNFAYPSLEVGLAIEDLAETAFRAGLDGFVRDLAASPIARWTARAAHDICRLTWLKRRLPVLANRDAAMEALLREARIPRHDERSSATPFTCDAMWLAGPDRYAMVLGPGDLGANQAHAPGEFMEVAALDEFADQVARLVLAFGRQA